MRDEDGTKWLPAARLIELLATLPSDSRVLTNSVQNLIVLTADGIYAIAYIDFARDGEVKSM